MKSIGKRFLTWLGWGRGRGSGILVCLVSVTAALYCVAAAQGSAMQAFLYISGWTEYATITIDSGGASLEQVHSALCESGCQTMNVLYLTQDEEAVYIGWDGTEATRWFPLSGGRFFTADEIANAEAVAVLSESEAAASLGESQIAIGGESYTIVGYGGFSTYHFRLGMEKSCYDDFFREEKPIRILPYTRLNFLEAPAYVLVQLSGMTTKQVRSVADVLAGLLPEGHVYPPSASADYVLPREEIQRAGESLALVALAGVTILQLMGLWVKGQRKELTVLRICGKSRMGCVGLVCGRWLILFGVSSILALGLHRLSFPLFSYFDAAQMPELGVYALLAGLVFMLSILCALPTIFRALDFTRREDRL